MDFSLSSSLVGSAVLGGDKLALDLQFALDKTLTARKGPTPVFTRASTGRFVGSNGLIQSAAINAPRFDHDPVTGVCKGLLMEESRTNICLQSENFGTTWAPSNSTVALNVAISPDGLTTADEIINGNGLTLGRVQQSFTLTGSHVYSVFAKVDGWNWVYIAPLQATGGVWFNLANGTVGTQNAGFVGSITPYGNGWYRCAVQFTGLGTPLTARIHPTNADTVFTVGDGSSGIFLWGAQMESGAFATSYIFTGASSVLRSADVCSITGSAFSGFYNASQGSLFANSFTPANGQRTIVAFDDNTANEMIRLRTEGTDPFYRVTDGGIDVVALDVGTVSANTTFRFSSAYAVNDFAATINGGAMSTSTSGTLPTVDRMRIGAGQSGNTICGCISSVKYFQKRLANIKLQALI